MNFYKQLEVTRTEHRFYAEIVTDITSRNAERKDTLKDITKTKKFSNTDPNITPGVNSGARKW